MLAVLSETFNTVDLARLAHAISETSHVINMHDILEMMNELVYRLPLRPSPAEQVVMDHGFAGILDYMRIYADRQTLEILMRYAGQFAGTHTERAAKDVGAAINNPMSRPQVPTVEPADAVTFDVIGPEPKAAPLQTDSSTPGTSPFTTPSHPGADNKRAVGSVGGPGEITRIREHIDGIMAHRDRSAVPQLCMYVGHESRAVRIAAIRALGELGDPRGRQALQQATTDGQCLNSQTR